MFHFLPPENVSSSGKSILEWTSGKGGASHGKTGAGTTTSVTATSLVTNDEVIIVTGVLIFWFLVIALFINKWGKIRMLEPYQPQYKQCSPVVTTVPSTQGQQQSSRVELDRHESLVQHHGVPSSAPGSVEVPRVVAQVHGGTPGDGMLSMATGSVRIAHRRHHRYTQRQSSVSVQHSLAEQIIARRAQSAENLYFDGINVQFSA